MLSTTRFGCGLRGRRTGIIWNDHLNDFTAPYTVNKFGLQPNGANFIQPGKRPLSDMSPAIVVGPGNNGTPQVRLVIGAAGATVITCALAWVRCYMDQFFFKAFFMLLIYNTQMKAKARGRSDLYEVLRILYRSKRRFFL